MSDRSFSSYAAEAQATFAQFEIELEKRGIRFVRACVFRSNEEQARLFKIGRGAPGRKVTWAQPGQSKHNRTADGKPASHAGDYYPLIWGKLADERTPEGNAAWMLLGEAAAAAGLAWGGNWSAAKREFPHVEFIEKG